MAARRTDGKVSHLTSPFEHDVSLLTRVVPDRYLADPAAPLPPAAKSIGTLLDQYTMPAAGKVIAFIVQAQIQPITSPSGASLLQVSGSNVVVPGDTLTLVFDGATLQPASFQLSTTFDGNPMTASGTFGTMTSGLNRLQYASAQVPSKQLSVLLHNYDYVPAN